MDSIEEKNRLKGSGDSEIPLIAALQRYASSVKGLQSPELR